MSTATETAMNNASRSQRREMAARQFASQITGLLRDYLAPRSMRDAHETLARAAYDNSFELTSLVMREEYEARGRLMLDLTKQLPATALLNTGQFSPQQEGEPHG